MKELHLVWPGFAEPVWLFALILPVLLLAWVWANRWLLPSRRVVLPLDRSHARGGWWWWTLLGLVESIPPLLLAVAVCILAGPQRNGPPEQKRSMTNIQFCLDVSGSMMSPYGDGTRYDGVVKAVDAFLDYRKGDAFGLTFFGDAFVHWVPLTTDPSALKCAPPFMRPDIAPPPFGGTAIAKALQACKKELAHREDGDRMILLITDGISYDLFNADQELVVDLKAANITVFCIIAAEFDPQAEIVNICRSTGGEAFRADDPDILNTVFKKIDTLKPAKITPTIVDTVDYYEPFALIGAILLALGTFALLGLRYTPW